MGLDDARLENVRQIGVLLDGGASLNVYYSAKAPDGAGAGRGVALLRGPPREPTAACLNLGLPRAKLLLSATRCGAVMSDNFIAAHARAT